MIIKVVTILFKIVKKKTNYARRTPKHTSVTNYAASANTELCASDGVCASIFEELFLTWCPRRRGPNAKRLALDLIAYKGRLDILLARQWAAFLCTCTATACGCASATRHAIVVGQETLFMFGWIFLINTKQITLTCKLVRLASRINLIWMYNSQKSLTGAILFL